MKNTEVNFYGRQDGEKVLFVVKNHSLPITIRFIKVYVASAIIFLATFLIDSYFKVGLVAILGLIFSLVFLILGLKLIDNQKKRGVAYITDRRIVRFEPTTFFATNIRTLSWDEVVKVKTFASNFLYKQMAIGNVVLHARSTVRTTEEVLQYVTADDIELKDVYYYKDLGNYIDKILYTYKQRPKEVSDIRPFILKPKGQRY